VKRYLLLLALIACGGSAQSQSFLGFDRNQYPGDANLAALRQTFAFSGYWLNHPPGEQSNQWQGKRQKLESAGFGFLVLFNGRLYRSLKNEDKAVALGKSDAQAAVAAAKREGFRPQTIIFLDQEEGGRMLPEQKAYIYAWVDGVTAAGFGAGIYCSGMPEQESGENIITAVDIRQNAAGRKISYFVTNDACPPSPGCGFVDRPPRLVASGLPFAEVWQFAQSPRRKDMTAACVSSYSSDGECYAPGTRVHVDLDTARTRDPSGGRSTPIQ
jgi:hypothetical protein